MNLPYKTIRIEKIKANGNCQYCTKKRTDYLIAFYDKKFKYGFEYPVPICKSCLAKKEYKFSNSKGFYFATRNKGKFFELMLDMFRTFRNYNIPTNEIPGHRPQDLIHQSGILWMKKE